MIQSINSLRMTRAKKAQRPRAVSISLPVPKTWNSRDGLANMKPDDAVLLENWWPSNKFLAVRNGYTPWSAGLDGYVETLMVYANGTNEKLFGATSNGTIYNTTGADSFLTTEAGDYIVTEDGRTLVADTTNSFTEVTGLSNGRWQYCNFSTPGGNYLRCVNGADYSRVYDGSAWHKDTDGAPYDITGVDSRTLIGICAHKTRLWFVQSNSLKTWYLPSLALGGAAVSFDLSSVAQFGGYVMGIIPWTIDAGYGVDDLLVFVTSQGEVIVYRGTDPASATTWALVGVWAIGAPVGRRCLFKWGGDVLIICQDGVFPMSGALQSSRINPKVQITDQIQRSISDAVQTAGNHFGWELCFYPNANQLILNVPIMERQEQQQYVMNTYINGWAQFTGWEAGCWELYNDQPYFGGNGFIGKAWDGYTDAGASITANCVQAFNYLGKPGIQKRAQLFQPIFYTNGTPSIQGGVNVDFDTTIQGQTLQVQTSPYAQWDRDAWDVGIFAPDLDVRKSWNGAKGVGNAFAPAFTAVCDGIQLQWVNSTLTFEEGGIV
jgi:hypothetical protein